MANQAIERHEPEFVVSDYAPIDLTVLPKDYPEKKRDSADIINFEIVGKTYRIDRFSEAIKHDPSGAIAWFNRGRAYFDAREYRHALLDFDKAISLNRNDPRFFNGRGLAYYYQELYDDALSEFEDIISRFGDALDPASRGQVAQALCNKGVTLNALGHQKQAIPIYDDLLNRFGQASEQTLREVVARALINKAFALSKLGRIDLEIAVYDDVLHRYGEASSAMMREVIAIALHNKSLALSKLGVRDKEMAIAVCDELVARFGDASECRATIKVRQQRQSG